ncbi:MAG: RHS repeat-associated core domain-containing protein, partial [Bacteroidales bacterium]|nr:RHS repeat-associated core domain-containing protein [Candidatus Cryptobacteroides caccocaballi]
DSSMPTVNSNRWRFAGKEIQPLGNTGWLDFGARQYDSFLGRWTTVDPLAEKYPGISPYSYCAGNPINFVDPDGKNWYYYVTDNGETKYEYYEGQLSSQDLEVLGWTDLGYTYLDVDKNRYYSLFGTVENWMQIDGRPAIGQLIQRVDELVINYALGKSNEETGNQYKTDFYIDGIENGSYRFNYTGQTFSSVTIDNPVKNFNDGTLYRACNQDNSFAWIHSWPNKRIVLSGYNLKYAGYWLQAVNGNGSYGGFRNIQIKFDENNAEKFLRSCNNIFGTKFYLKN